MEALASILETKGNALYTTKPTTSVLQAADDMCRKHVGALLVMQDHRPIGIFSERDLLVRVILARKEPSRTTVQEVMTRDVVCISVDRPPEEAMAIMSEKRCRHLPVVSAGTVIGMLSIGDLTRWASQNQAFEMRMLSEYLSGKYPG